VRVRHIFIVLKQYIIVIISCVLLSCAGPQNITDEAADAAPAQGSDCISSGTIRDYRVLDDANLVVTGSATRRYHVTLSRRAVGLQSTWAIGFRSTGTQICPGFDDLIVDSGLGPERVRIASIKQVTPEEYEQLLVRFGKKEPEIEQAPAPHPVEGAAVEELD